ncbi:hypothetical protein ACIBQ6_21785 [Nonomuraea sp. NPDC049655]|uniref:hypothetical protein n=1 Tax=Nonomuraea sp. NPDC049655 TaxID=3364355 RepID=UPI0037BD86D6
MSIISSAPEQNDVSAETEQRAEELARSFNLLAAFIRLNPELAGIFRASFRYINLPITESRDAEEVLRAVALMADTFGLPIEAGRKLDDVHSGVTLLVGSFQLEVYADSERLPLPIHEYLPMPAAVSA